MLRNGARPIVGVRPSARGSADHELRSSSVVKAYPAGGPGDPSYRQRQLDNQ